MSYIVGILVAWNIVLTLFFLFDKSRIDCVEKSIGSLVKYLSEGENDWR